VAVRVEQWQRVIDHDGFGGVVDVEGNRLQWVALEPEIGMGQPSVAGRAERAHSPSPTWSVASARHCPLKPTSAGQLESRTAVGGSVVAGLMDATQAPSPEIQGLSAR
jgi:hypothetical protein